MPNTVTIATPRFEGVLTALATPFHENGSVAYGDLRKLVEYQISKGIDGLVSVGTTGESPTLDTGEHLEVIAKTVEFAAGRVPVLAGTGSNSTDEAVALTRHADGAGADAFLIVAPYYNKPGPEGLYRHFAKIADCTSKPIVLYSIPGRCGIEIPVDTAVRLRKTHPHVCAIKEAGGSCDKVSQLVRALDPEYAVLCGDDGLTLPFVSLGARGVVSVASNWLPGPVLEMTHLALKGDRIGALAWHNRLADCFRQIFVEANPVPIKHLLHLSGIFATSLPRLPLCELSAENRRLIEKLHAALHPLA
ncbi:MAG: 4-hydroxy-tetrahydrodipicolinate synthase [Puniceicoccales bacterium]|jgi:4-hydroxy-tetrahydrodipicolinate synthase|nr:4-hydroxy-tetrahydrodipicolinate synthase [Puniceicoccales bacterium]